MSKEKQIEEMAEVLRHSCDNECFKNKDGFADCEACEACLLYNAGYRKQSEWISVEERLPPKFENVFVCCNGVLGIDFIGSTGQWYESFPIAVTHWMPLPEAPKGGEE